ncbi:MAG: M16 family metallopeptidase [Minisyncoccia bacterium]
MKTKVIKKVLNNGLRVIFVPMKDNPTVTVTVLVGTGSDYEPEEQTGLSHFLEHMCFKGTKKRPGVSGISRELDSLGAHYNAFTDHEMTGYYAKVESKHALEVLDIISDIYINSTFPQTEVEKERGVIIEEINMYEDMPQSQVQQLFTNKMFEGQPAGRDVLGTKESVSKMNQENFVTYHRKFYVPNNTVLVVAGSFNNANIMSAIKKSFSNAKKVPLPKIKKTVDNQSIYKSNVLFKNTDQSHMVFGFQGLPASHKDQVVLSIIASLLGGGMSSRLFTKLRDEMGVCYYVNAYNDFATSYGIFEITTGVTNARTEEVLKVLIEECKDLKNNLVPESELKRIKQYMVGTMKLSLESSNSLAMYFGAQEILLRKTLNPEERIKLVMSVTSKDIMRVAKKVFVLNKLNLAIIGPWKDSGWASSILNTSSVL